MEKTAADILTPTEGEYMETGWGIKETGGKIEPIKFPRGAVGDFHVKFEMLYCGICHTDVHQGGGDWGPSQFPMLPGHELLGRVVEVGPKVTKFKVGENCAVGCFVDSCRDCEMCKDGDENYCLNGMTGTYNGDKKHGRVPGNQDTKTQGGYTCSNVVHEDYVIKIPEGMDLSLTSPILCAGITMYSPLKFYGPKDDKKITVGIIGIGGLGTMGIKLAKALGHTVMAISTSANKEQMAKDKGADLFCASKDEESMKKNAKTCDLILNTVSADHQVSTYMPLMKKNATIVQLGGVIAPHMVSNMTLMMGR